MWRRVVGQVYRNRLGHGILDGDDEEEDFDPVTYDNSCSESLMSLYAQKKEKGEIAAPPEIIPSEDAKKMYFGLEELEGEVTIAPLSPTVAQVSPINSQKGNVLEETEARISMLKSSSEDDIEMECKYAGFRSFPQSKEKQSNHIPDVEHENSVWSAIHKEANTLVCFKDKKGNSSYLAQHEGKRRQKGTKKRKQKLSFNFQSRSRDHSVVNAIKGETFELFSAQKIGTREPSFADLIEEFQHEISEQEGWQQSEEVEKGENTFISKRPEVLKGGSSLRISKMKEDDGKAASSCIKASHLGDRVLDDHECLEFPSSDSSDNEANFEKRNQLILAPGEVKDRAMVDIFHEAFSDAVGESEMDTFKPKGIGFNERLQHVIQREKENQAQFLVMLQTCKSEKDESNCVFVKVLSRAFDGKLIVCRCLLCDKIKFQNCRSLEEGMEKTVIFQPKICGKVELEVGKLICIHPPWKDVQVTEDEGIMLCMYFSEAEA